MKSLQVSGYLSIALLLTTVTCYKILGIFPLPSTSHYSSCSALMKGLAAAGHEVTVVSQHPQARPLPNYRDITLNFTIDDPMNSLESSILETYKIGFIKTFAKTFGLGKVQSSIILREDAMQRLLNNATEQFDVIIFDVFRIDALYGLGYHFNAPLIGLTTFEATKWATDLVGTPTPLSYVPNPFLSLTTRMSFAQRLGNTLMAVLDEIVMHIYLNNQCEIYERAFPGKSKPDLRSVRKNFSLVLVNSHFSIAYPRPYVPNMIEIGGIHIDRNAANELPMDIRNFVESTSEHGFIYFSIGSHLRSADLPGPVRDGILKAFSKLKQKVLWKYEDPNLPGKPDNVMIRKWFPQNDVLKHPNLRLFITHGGLLSCTEAVYHGVPIMGIPIFGDQNNNIANAVDKGYGVLLSYTNLTDASISWALTEMLRSSKYAENAKLFSARYRDQPMTPLQTGVFWVEYVARHKGAPHMHSAGQDLSWIAHRNIDVYAFLMLIAYAFYWITKVLMHSLIRKLFKKSPSVSKTKKSD